MSDWLRETIKNHAKGTGRILLIHLLAVALGWAAYPLILLLIARYTTVDLPMAIFSVIASLVYAAMLVSQGNEYGLRDGKPYNWARYKAKGFVLGAAAGLVIFLAELIVIAIADRNFYVSHPQFDIANVNSYIRMILYVPFFWFYKLIHTGEAIIPRVNILTSLFVIPFCSLFTGLGYLFGAAGVVVDFRPKKKKV
ncbi:MAG: hypothetical protein K6G89_05080 [Clostridia bacterium]|nr:hypothetical protein [Clostridia bacterium]